MKKWFDWQFENQYKENNWDKWTTPLTNLKDDLDWFFADVKEGVASGRIGSWFENVFYRSDWTERTAAGAGIDSPTLWQWTHDTNYSDLMDNAGIIKINEFEESVKKKLLPILAEKLCLKEETINFYCHNEPAGHLFPMHFDRNKWGKFSMNEDTTYDPHYGLFIIFFDDWQHGQAFQMGTKFLSWKSGDVFSWDHVSTPHGSCNFGYEDRYTLLVNGEFKDADPK